MYLNELNDVLVSTLYVSYTLPKGMGCRAQPKSYLHPHGLQEQECCVHLDQLSACDVQESQFVLFTLFLVVPVSHTAELNFPQTPGSEACLFGHCRGRHLC